MGTTLATWLTIPTMVLLAGCAGSPKPLHPFSDPIAIGCAAGAQHAVALQYLGAGGYLMRWGDATIMTAPFYSNPNIIRVGLWTIEPDRDRIEAHLPDVGGVRAILVGHAHYDHLMDAAWIAEHRAPQATVYGSRTMVNQLAAKPGIVAVSLEEDAGDAWHEGAWTEVAPRIYVMALRSEHAPHLGPITLFGGEVRCPRTKLPSTAWGWKEGQTLGFLIEFRNADDSVAVRLHYQDSASTPPLGFPPPTVRRIDVALLCAASFANVPSYPEALLHTTAPRAVLLTHWEDFFRSPNCAPLVVRGTNGAELARRLDATRLPWHTPLPGAWTQVCAAR